MIISLLGKISPGHSNQFLEELGITDNSKNIHEKINGEKLLKDTIVSLDQVRIIQNKYIFFVANWIFIVTANRRITQVL